MRALGRIDSRRLPELSEKLWWFAQELKRRLPVERVIVHGSAARGELTETSDIDLIVMGDFPQRMPDRIGQVMALAPPELPLEPLCYTPEEVERMLAAGNPFLTRALTEGSEVSGPEPFVLKFRGTR